MKKHNMTFDEWKMLAVRIKKMYRRYDKFLESEDDVRDWYEYLDDLQYFIVKKAVKRFIRASPYPPTIADIRSIYGEIRTELRDQLKLVKQELQMFEWRFCMGYNGRRLECEREFERLTVGKCGNDYALARKLGIEIRRRGEEYIANGGTMYLLDWLRAQE